MTRYRRMGRERKRYLIAYRVFEESTEKRTGLRDTRTEFRAQRRQRRAFRKQRRAS